MRRLINLLARSIALCEVRCLEIELHDQTDALQHVSDVDACRAICTARDATQRALLKARQHYLSLLPPGHCPTWRNA